MLRPLLLTLVGVLLALPILAGAESSERACASIRVNAKGVAGASVVVDGTVGGVVVADANTSRCMLWLDNDTANAMRCAPSSGPYALVVSTTVGFLWPATTVPILGWAAQNEWKCIRTTGTSTAVSVMEGLP